MPRSALAYMLCLVCLHGADGIPETGVAYRDIAGQRLTLDIHRPPTPGAARPALLLVHGGAWRAGSPADFAQVAPLFAGQGYVTFSIAYRLVTETGNRWPAQLDDARAAVRWIRANAARFGVDPARIGALGGSAGGHIVACLGAAREADSSPTTGSGVACVINMAGPTDLTRLLAGTCDQGAWCDEQIALLLGGSPLQLVAHARSASPRYLADARTAPTLLLQGSRDDIVPASQAQEYAKVLARHGVEARLVMFDGGHGLEKAGDMVRVMYEVLTFFARHLRP